LNFRWDDAKEKKNIQKHHFSFSYAKFVFDDPERMERPDLEHSGTEDRWQTLGLIDGLLFVVYTIRGDDCQLITARAANEDERRIYNGTNKRNTHTWTKAN
jgi:uncharacterized DUF497 family protein